MSGLGTQGGPIVELADDPAETDHECVATLDDPRLALQLYYRVADYLPRTLGDWDLLCIRPQMELVRYRRGRRSKLHRDPTRFGTQAERSVLTLLVYLNEEFEGGATEFPKLDRSVAPATGEALIFEQDLDHRGALVTEGQKMVLRASVFYVPGHMRAKAML